jgi:hypothetical protein
LIGKEQRFLFTFSERIEFYQDDPAFAQKIAQQMFDCYLNIADIPYLTSSVIFEQEVEKQQHRTHRSYKKAIARKHVKQQLQTSRPEILPFRPFKIFLDGEELLPSTINMLPIPKIESKARMVTYFMFSIEGIDFNGHVKSGSSIDGLSVNQKIKLRFEPPINAERWTNEKFFSNLVEILFTRSYKKQITSVIPSPRFFNF